MTPSADSKSIVLSTKAALTIPLVLVIVSIVASNLTMHLGLQSKTSILDTKFDVVAEDVREIKGTLSFMSKELTTLKVEVATLKATSGGN